MAPSLSAGMWTSPRYGGKRERVLLLLRELSPHYSRLYKSTQRRAKKLPSGYVSHVGEKFTRSWQPTRLAKCQLIAAELCVWAGKQINKSVSLIRLRLTVDPIGTSLRSRPSPLTWGGIRVLGAAMAFLILPAP